VAESQRAELTSRRPVLQNDSHAIAEILCNFSVGSELIIQGMGRIPSMSRLGHPERSGRSRYPRDRGHHVGKILAIDT